MPSPTAADVHVDAVLTNISVAYRQSAANFIADRVFPEVAVDKQSDKYFKYDKGDWFRDEAQYRAPATESAGSGYRIGTDNYSCDVVAFHKDVDDQTRANYDNPLDPDADATSFVTNRMLMRLERDWVTQFWGTGKWSNDRNGVASAPVAGTSVLQWNDAASKPIDNVEEAKLAILQVTGFMPNTMVIGYEVYRHLKQHPSVYDRLKYTTSDNITREILARFFEVDRLFVAQSIVNTGAREPDASGADSFSFVFGKHAWLGYVAPTPGLLQPSAGYRFSWRGVSDGLGQTIGITRFRMPQLRADRIESQMAWDYKIVAADLGFFWNGVVA